MRTMAVGAWHASRRLFTFPRAYRDRRTDDAVCHIRCDRVGTRSQPRAVDNVHHVFFPGWRLPFWNPALAALDRRIGPRLPDGRFNDFVFDTEYGGASSVGHRSGRSVAVTVRPGSKRSGSGAG